MIRPTPQAEYGIEPAPRLIAENKVHPLTLLADCEQLMRLSHPTAAAILARAAIEMHARLLCFKYDCLPRHKKSKGTEFLLALVRAGYLPQARRREIEKWMKRGSLAAHGGALERSTIRRLVDFAQAFVASEEGRYAVA